MPPSVLRRDGQVVDVDLPPRSLDLVEFVGNKSVENLAVRRCHNGDDVLLCQEVLQVVLSGLAPDGPFGQLGRGW